MKISYTEPKHQCRFYQQDDTFCPRWAIKGEPYCLEHLAESFATNLPAAPAQEVAEDAAGRSYNDAGDYA